MSAGRIRISRRCNCCRTCSPSRPRARRGAFETWFYDEAGLITEGSSTNAWIVSEGELVTRPLDDAILAGVTRATLIDVAASLGLRFAERAFSREQAYAAREAFISAATLIVMPVVEIDGRKIGDGRPGPVSLELRRRFHHVASRG